ncbi:MAG: DUF3612 domain-containing protein [Steroidobacteraceae bacterium]
MSALLRKGHFLGTKLRAVRKLHGLTLEELSARCVHHDASQAPSVSYLSMIETGRRVPSEAVLDLLAAVLQRDRGWFLDESAVPEIPRDGRSGPVSALPLQPGFLFSKELLQAALPELLAQTGTSGRQFAHLLIRSHQELSHNDFPDLERAAESIGERRFPLSVDDLLELASRHGLNLHWFERKPVLVRDESREVRSMVRSFYEAPNDIYINKALRSDPARLKFDIAAHIGHKILHGGDGLKSAHATGGEMGGSPESSVHSGGLDANDVLHAWRDFECTFFAGALLCPKVPFRRYLASVGYRIDEGVKLGLTPAVVMRRMTKVSPYPYWHFFDAYPPGYLRAVYRGNGIPLPWGNMAQVTDPCPHWAVFRMIDDHRKQSGSQISVLRDGERSLLYCCHSMRTRDMAGNPHVLSVGVDCLPVLHSNGIDTDAMVKEVLTDCQKHHGEAPLRAGTVAALQGAAKVLNIDWILDALEHPARIICPRSNSCPRDNRCAGARPSRARQITDVRAEILHRDRDQPDD